MLFSPLTPTAFILLAFLQIVTFGGDWLARICAVWLTPRPYDAQKLQSDSIRQAYKNTPYFYICWSGLCAMIFETVTHLSSGAIFGSFPLQQGLLFGFMALLTGLPLWGCRGLLRCFSVGQGLLVTVTAVLWPSLLSQPPWAAALWIFHTDVPWMLISWGGYMLCFVGTAQWRKPLPLRDHRLQEGEPSLP